MPAAPTSTPIARARVRWPAIVRGSAGLHLGAGAITLAAPHLWPWTLGAIVANHAVLATGGLWPRSQWMGSNWIRLPDTPRARTAVALSFDDGPDPNVTPRVLDLLDAAGVKATFFAIGTRVSAHPALAREIVERGHALENHSWRHVHTFSVSGPRAMRREIVEAQRVIADTTGVAPRCFRAPAGLRNPFLDPLLQQLGLQLTSWTRRGFDTREADPMRVCARLLRGLAARDILLLHDGHAAGARDGRPVVLDALPRVLDAIAHAALQPVLLRDML
ncbi:polysaccharide deacetylase family protein [Pararobbsia silviterrae]|nr:polysaccharide deacetylase family protein [Pararobbsia silviterrae]